MIKLSRKLEYSLISLKHLGNKKKGDLTSAKEISSAYGISFDVISRILQTLNQNKIVKSIQGVQGGYYLVRDLNEINFYELIEIIEGPLTLVKCMIEDYECELKATCNIADPLKALNHKLHQFYKTIRLSELVNGEYRDTVEEREEERSLSSNRMLSRESNSLAEESIIKAGYSFSKEENALSNK